MRDYAETAKKSWDGRILRNLGLMYSDGNGVPLDAVKAVELFQRAADINYVPAINNLGVMSEKGEGVAQDKAKAVELFTKAVDMGLGEAKEALEIISKQ